jgi:hypothetical protein
MGTTKRARSSKKSGKSGGRRPNNAANAGSLAQIEALEAENEKLTDKVRRFLNDMEFLAPEVQKGSQRAQKTQKLLA